MNNNQLEQKVFDSIKGMIKQLETSWPGYKVRSGQQEMMFCVAKAMLDHYSPETRGAERTGKNIAVIDAPTGVGKTLGYLIPGIAVSSELDKPLVLSTGTVALQEQLVNRDIPMLEKALGLDLDYGLIKGRGRYMCLARAKRLLGDISQTSFLEDMDNNAAIKTEEIELVRDSLTLFTKGKWAGDEDSMTTKISPVVWRRMNADRNMCTGRACKEFGKCAFYAARTAAKSCKIIVSNHDLILSTSENESNALPDLDNCLVVFDEGHHLPDRALNHGVKKSHVDALRADVPKLLGPYTSAINLFGVMKELKQPIDGYTSQLADELRTVYSMLAKQRELNESERGLWRFQHGVVPAPLLDCIKKAKDITSDLLRALNTAIEGFNEVIESVTDQELAQTVLMSLGGHVDRLEQFEQLAGIWTYESQIPNAKWVLKVTTKGPTGHVDFVLHGSPMTASSILNKLLWRKVGAGVVCSATITSCGSFDYFAKLSGLMRLPNVNFTSVQSPFDYPSQGTCTVPSKGFNPKEVSTHTAEVIGFCGKAIAQNRHGMLVLFASRKQMEAVYAGLPTKLRHQVLIQGSLPRHKILDAHRDSVKRGNPSTLFGLQGFGEGLDLAGQDCEHVIIAKVPFDPPDSPIEEALSEWLQTQQRNPFMEITVPKAGIKLNQYAGRLIRTESDQGQISILDSRLVNSKYGAVLLNGLPNFTKNIA